MTRLLLLLLSCWLALPVAAGSNSSANVLGQSRDLTQIRASGELRVLINQSWHSAAERSGQAIGVEYRRLRAFEQFLNRGQRSKLQLKLIHLPKDQLLTALREGRGDLIAPGELLEVDAAAITASVAIEQQVPLVVVGNTRNRHYRTLADMSGRVLTVARGSAVPSALQAHNKQLRQMGREDIAVRLADPSLAVEDVLQMVQAGIYPWTAVELSIAQRWRKVFPQLRIERHLQVGEGDLHWYWPVSSTELATKVNAFLPSYHLPHDQDTLLAQVYRRHRIDNPLRTPLIQQRLKRVSQVLYKHAQLHQLDWLYLAALGYKESTLNPGARGSGGAQGLLQVTPAAARSVGISNVQVLDNNVLASSRYLVKIRREYFSDPEMAEAERMAFVLAGYNMGPQRIHNLRSEAAKRGLDPNRWFFHVERVAFEHFGAGVVSYVRSVHKYYLGFAQERVALERGLR